MHELIKLIQAHLKEHGDAPVMFYDYNTNKMSPIETAAYDEKNKRLVLMTNQTEKQVKDYNAKNSEGTDPS